MDAERDGVSGAEVEAAAAALDPRLFARDQDPSSPFAGTLDQWRHGARLRARRILEAAASVRPATPGDGAVGLAGEVADLQARLAVSESAARGLNTMLAFVERRRDVFLKCYRTEVLGRREDRLALAAAEARAAAAERERDGARAVLRRVEWTGNAWVVEGSGAFCPDCQGWDRDGHFPNCALAAALAAPQPSGALGSLKTQSAENQASPSDSPDNSDLALVEQGAEHQGEPSAAKTDPGEDQGRSGDAHLPQGEKVDRGVEEKSPATAPAMENPIAADPGDPGRARAQAFKEANELLLSVQRSTSDAPVDRCLRSLASILHRRTLAAGSADGGEHRANRGTGNDENPARDAVGRDGGGVGGVE